MFIALVAMMAPAAERPTKRESLTDPRRRTRNAHVSYEDFERVKNRVCV